MQNSMYSTETWIMKINKKETKGYAAEWRSEPAVEQEDIYL